MQIIREIAKSYDVGSTMCCGQDNDGFGQDNDGFRSILKLSEYYKVAKDL